MEELNKRLKELGYSEEFLSHLKESDNDILNIDSVDFTNNLVNQTTNDVDKLIIDSPVEPQTTIFVISQV